MTTFTSSIPDDLMVLLKQKANELSLPKNKIIEKALRLYLEQLEKAEYVKSYRKMQDDADTLLLAEEGMAEYYKTLSEDL